MKGPLRLVFMGSDAIALPLLEWLGKGAGRAVAEVVAVITQPDRAVGRGQRVTPNAIKHWAQARNLPILQPEKLTEDVRSELASFAPDLALVMAYGHLLRDDFIATPRLGTLNLHTSILPRYRGASPIQTAVAQGETETGVTLMRIVRRLDAGPVADVERVPIGALDTADIVETRLAAACVPLLARAMPRLAAGSLAFAEQDETAATHCRKLRREDGVLDFQATAGALAARINGLFPWPACTLTLQGQLVKIGLADVAPLALGPGEPGTILGADEVGLQVATREGTLRLRRLQRPGGRMLAATDFLRGFAVPAGTQIDSIPMPPLLATR